MIRLQSKPGEGQRATHPFEPKEANPFVGGLARAAREARVHNQGITLPVSKLDTSLRWQLRDFLRKHSSRKSAVGCGKYPIGTTVTLRAGKGVKPGFGGLQSCGSQSCPVCAARIAAHRKQEVEAVVNWAVGEGYRVSMLTLTQRHNVRDSLLDLWNSLTVAWQYLTSGRRWVDFKEQIGFVGFVKAVEVTRSEQNGWHVHQHILIISERDPVATPIFYQRKQGRRKQPYPVEIYTCKQFIAERWQRGLAKSGADFLPEKGMDWQTAESSEVEKIAGYVSKMQGAIDGLAKEVTLGAMKRGRGGSLTPFQMLVVFREIGDLDYLDWFKEFEKVSKGRRTITYSGGLRDLVNLGREKTDEEIVAEDDLHGEVVAVFNSQQWKKVYEHGPENLLLAVEKFGVAAGYQWLRERNIGYSMPDDLVEESPKS